MTGERRFFAVISGIYKIEVNLVNNHSFYRNKILNYNGVMVKLGERAGRKAVEIIPKGKL